jgi:hypothetical protein
LAFIPWPAVSGGRALADLARVGVVRTEHGVGSFVASLPLPHRIDDGQVSLVESMTKTGHAVRQLILDAHRVDPAIGQVSTADPAGGEAPPRFQPASDRLRCRLNCSKTDSSPCGLFTL